MKDFFLAVKLGLYHSRFNLMAMILACGGWLVFAHLVMEWGGKDWLDAFAYCLLGWFWLGRVVMPWVEHKLEELFGE